MYNVFRKGTNVDGFGKMAEQLAFDLHALFKVYLERYHRTKKCLGENGKVCIYVLVKGDSLTLFPGMPYLPPIMKIESKIVKQYVLDCT